MTLEEIEKIFSNGNYYGLYPEISWLISRIKELEEEIERLKEELAFVKKMKRRLKGPLRV